MIVFVLEYWVDCEGGGIIGVFATEEDARKVFWAEVANGDISAGDGVFISRREVGKTAGELPGKTAVPAGLDPADGCAPSTTAIR